MSKLPLTKTDCKLKDEKDGKRAIISVAALFPHHKRNLMVIWSVLSRGKLSYLRQVGTKTDRLEHLFLPKT